MSLRTRMALAMIVLVAVTAGSVAWLATRTFGNQGLPEALDRLGGEARLMAGALQAAALGASADVLVLARVPAATTLATEGAERLEARQTLTATFAAELQVKRRYLRLAFVDVEGRELVHVDRSPTFDSARASGQRDLRDDRGRLDPSPTPTFVPGTVQVSPPDVVGDVAVLRLSTPVAASDGEVGGLVVVTMSMSPLFTAILADAPEGRGVYVIGDSEYLVHPDSSPRAGDAASTRHWSEDFPELSADFLEEGTHTALTAASGGRVGFAARTIRLAGGPPLTVVLTEPADRLLAGERQVVRSALLGGSLVALMATLLAATMARSLSRPVAELARSVQRFESTGTWRPPSRPSGEVAALSETFTRAVQAEQRQRANLQREIENRRAAEKALEREAKQLRLLSAVVQSSLDGIFTLTLDGVITSWNPGAERLYGYTEDEMIGRHKATLVPGHLRGELDDILERLRRGEPVRDLETTRITKEGVERDVLLTLSPVYSDTGEVIGISEIARNIGERKALEERFRLSVEACPNGMVMVDEAGAIVLVNREVERLFGYDRDEILGESIEILVPESARGGHPEQRRAFVDHPQRRAMGSGRDLFGRRRDGTEIPVEIGLNPIHTPDGLFVLASIVDISERIKAEEELRRSNAELEQFAYVASHDLQEPLRMVASYTELLAQRYEGRLDERADRYIRYAADGAKTMQRLIDDLLTFSRIDSEAMPLAPTDLGALVREVVDRRLAAAVREAGASLEVGSLPVALADELQVAQVFQNLISNALKFRAEDRPPVIRIEGERRRSECVVSVADNGIGIDPGHEESVFEMFQRLHAGSYPGSGIGLTLCRKIVQRHGGRIWFDSVPGFGTTFHFTLPVAPT